MSVDISDYLTAEIAAGEKSYRFGLIGLGIVALLLIVYFQWLSGQVKEITSPGNVAAVALTTVRSNIPSVRDSLKKNLKQSAPELVQFVSDTVLDKTVPMLRGVVEGLFREYSRELTHFGVEATAKVFEEIIKEQKDELRERISLAPGVYTTEQLISDLDGFIAREFVRRLNDSPTETTAFKLKQSAVALRNINARLQSMAKAAPNTKKDALGRKLITTWWTLLQNIEPTETAAEKMLSARKIAKTPEDQQSPEEDDAKK